MKIRKLAITWAFLYGVTAALGFVNLRSPLLYFCKILLSLAFFVPAGMLVYQGVSRGDYRLLKIIRNLSIVSLGSTTLLLVLTFFSAAYGSEGLGILLHFLLTLVSAPMIASDLWIVPLFGWACLMMVCIEKGEKKKKNPKKRKKRQNKR